MMQLKGSCHCGAVEFEFDSPAPVPAMRCYCSICRKTSGGGGYTVNIMGMTDSLQVTKGQEMLKSYRAIKNKEAPRDQQVLCQNRYFCTNCASYLWAHCDDYAQWIYPYASAIDTELPVPKATASLMLNSAKEWADPRRAKNVENDMFEEYPTYSLEQWHKDHNELR
ncbi:hypothetical protein GGI25_006457 [Coemansia spiralis]|uniref:CENP-V/GFA domain-containing protein n=2 Tax=Coemansia TaxID=4863 RepID=A0A9W8KTP6_9FUNG|nr:Mss4-like protein [Coemansia spiralis]KAJ1989556.1 hypothetical protein EDC05_004590 [Coemansia umbellata]KAJ2625728.1 hypothetical protein GGI26_000528 [Coemansia sp. RSA 1358]KAJ2668361.1 hypothetical protein GGI25_006457 [Coemansia spiralis]